MTMMTVERTIWTTDKEITETHRNEMALRPHGNDV